MIVWTSARAELYAVHRDRFQDKFCVTAERIPEGRNGTQGYLASSSDKYPRIWASSEAGPSAR